jgi:hypothetical protein
VIRVTRSAVIDAPIARVWEVLRDFNSHWAWHPAVGESSIENGEAPDQVGCVRNFFLKDGNHIREQLLALSDRDYVSTYCILDATLPMKHYVATVQLKHVTDGDRTFWLWQSTFECRHTTNSKHWWERVYEGQFEGLRLRGAARLPLRSQESARSRASGRCRLSAGRRCCVTNRCGRRPGQRSAHPPDRGGRELH